MTTENPFAELPKEERLRISEALVAALEAEVAAAAAAEQAAAIESLRPQGATGEAA